MKLHLSKVACYPWLSLGSAAEMATILPQEAQLVQNINSSSPSSQVNDWHTMQIEKSELSNARRYENDSYQQPQRNSSYRENSFHFTEMAEHSRHSLIADTTLRHESRARTTYYHDRNWLLSFSNTFRSSTGGIRTDAILPESRSFNIILSLFHKEA